METEALTQGFSSTLVRPRRRSLEAALVPPTTKLRPELRAIYDELQGTERCAEMLDQRVEEELGRLDAAALAVRVQGMQNLAYELNWVKKTELDKARGCAPVAGATQVVGALQAAGATQGAGAMQAADMTQAAIKSSPPSPKKITRCRVCGDTGHNARTCKVRDR